MAQGFAVLGAYGFTGLTLIAFVSLTALVPGSIRNAARSHTLLLLVFVWGTMLLVGVWGAWRLASNPTSYNDQIRLRLVQTNVSQADKWRQDLRGQHFYEHLNASRQPFLPDGGLEDPDLFPTTILWPETAIAFDPTSQADVAQILAAQLPPGSTLITGAPRFQLSPEGLVEEIWNSAITIQSGDSTPLAVYDKHHLVPFGEYMPLPDWLGLQGIATVGTEFSAGFGPDIIDLPDGIVDSFGRVTAAIGLSEAGTLDAFLPLGLEERPVPLWVHQGAPILLWIVMVLVAVLVGKPKAQR